ncbi:hypothetical protein DUNSADRAFT_1711 [Dunaliella salina]|nr:hypothetical protein DUNSADRAFT_1711 [Dunaliella salina]|eukprot:KAF5826937.1 hypothetical protein DUNSADRAFT_1711 [Dunaliella salina]
MATQVASIKWMPSTSDRRFIVDGFNFQTPSCRTYFLTHYHSDHTTGLSRGFSSGTIYTSEVTARLLIHDMGIKPNVIRALPMHTPIMIEGCRVTLLNANHCPGAVMLLVEVVEGGPRKVLLHTGDCRWAEGMADQIPAGVRVDEIFLDTTYCMPRHSFPPQQHVIQSLVREVQLLGQPLNPSGNQSNAITQPPACQNSAPNQSMVDRTPTDHFSTCTIHSPSADPTAAASLGWAEGAHLGQQQLQPQHPKLLVGQTEQQLEQMEQQEQQQHPPHHYQQNHHQQQHKDEAHCKDLDASPSLGSNASVQTACFLSNKTPHAGLGSGANSAPFNQSSPHARTLPMHTSPIHDSGGTFGDGMPATTPAAGAGYGVQEKEALQSAGTADPNLAAAEQGRPQPARTSGCSSSSSSSGAVGSMAGCTPETHGLAANLAKSSSFTAGHASGTPAISADTLVVVAAYRIGKERVFLGLARALGVKVWCSPAKRRVLAQLGLSDPDWALLTDDPFQAQLHVVSWGMKPEALHRKYLGTPPGTLPPRRSQLSQSAQQNAPTAAPAALEDQAQKDGPHLLAPGVRREGETAGTHLEECHGSPALGLGSAGGNKSGRTCQSKEGLGEDEAEEFEEDEGCGAWEGRDEEDEEEEGGVPLHSAADTVKGDFCGSITANTSNSSNIKVEGGTGVAAAGGAAYEGGGPELRSRAHWRRVIGIRPTGWSFRPRARSLFSHWSLGAVTVISAPYSEHSSFTELCACIKALRPTKIIPTVNAATPAEARTIINRFAPLMDLSR